MARKKRYTPAGVPLHIVQRGVDGETTFRCEQDFKVFIKWLKHYTIKNNVSIHAWVLMRNHIHMLITPNEQKSVSSLMANLCSRYAGYFNRQYDRTGGLWQGRYFSGLIASNYYLLCCYRYIEQNPVRASIVENVYDYKWSSFRCNGMGYESDLHTPHATYLSLGNHKAERLKQYQKLFDQDLPNEDTELIRQQTHGNGILVRPGNEALVKKRLELII